MRLEGGVQSLYAKITPLIESKKIRSIEKKEVREIIKSTSIAEAIDKMSKTDVGAYLIERFRQGASAKDLELFSWRFLADKVYEFYEDLPSDAKLAIDSYLNKYDLLNVKAAIRRIIGTSAEAVVGVPLGCIYRYGKLEELLQCNSMGKVSELLGSLSMGKYAKIIEMGGDRIKLEHALEDEYFRNLLRVGRAIGDAHILRVFGVLVDLTNILILLRSVARGKKATRQDLLSQIYMLSSKEMEKFCTFFNVEEFLAELTRTYYHHLATRLNKAYMSSGDPALLESLINEYANYVAKQEFWVSMFTPAYMLSYTMFKENEMRLVTSVLKVVEEQVPSDMFVKYL